MSQVYLANFKYGLDARRSELSSVPGTLLQLNNGHINEGGECEKRKEFAQTALPSGTFGMLCGSSSIYTFGSGSNPFNYINGAIASATWTGNVNIQIVLAAGTYFFPIPGELVTITGATGSLAPLAGVKFTVTTVIPGSYTINGITTTTGSFGFHSGGISLSSIMVYQQLTPPDASNMTAVISATLISNLPFVVASFSSGNTFCFYNGTVVPDFYAGLVTSWINTDGQIATAIGQMVNATGSSPISGEPVYTASVNSNTVTITSTPTTTSSGPYTTSTTTTLEPGSTGALTDFLINSGAPEVAATGASSTITIYAGTTGPQANATLVGSSSTNIVATNSISIGPITYTFVIGASASSALSGQPPYTVYGGASGLTSTDTAYANLVLAINGTGAVGTNYSTGTVAHPTVTAGNVTAHNVVVTAILSGTAQNSIPVSTSPSSLAGVSTPWEYSSSATTTLQGGTNTNYINQISFGGTNLLASIVQFDQNVNQTASDIAAAINANTATGFTASVSSNSIVVTAPASTGTAYNGSALTIQAVGNVCCAFCSFTIVTMSGGQQVSTIVVGGVVDLLQGTPIAFDTSNSQTATDIAAAINSFTSTTHYLACAIGAAVYIAPTTINSTVSPSIVVTDTATSILNTTSSGLTAIITPNVITTNFVSGSPNNGQSNPFSCVVSGGTPPYHYSWSTVPALPIGKPNGSGLGTISISSTTSPSIYFALSQWSANYNQNFILTCNVTDSASPTPNTASAQATWVFNSST